MDIHIRSEGYEDPDIVNRGGTAYIEVNGHDHSPHGRGHNVVVVDAATGNVTLSVQCFLIAIKQSEVPLTIWVL